jgi:serine/threonine-protein kinase
VSNLLERARAALAGRYDVERELGHGGMATVLLARDLRHDRPVAVKVLRPELTAALGADRFLREVRITANLSHPHILPLLDSGEADGLLYYVMPYVTGESLRARLDREGRLPPADALAIAREVADALGYAHRRGIVHRDVKPENILLEGTHALVADFGIARATEVPGADRLTTTGLAIGTPRYMSPEQAAGDGDVDGRTDTYALACVLYESLAGAPPFTGPNAVAVTAAKLTAAVPPLAQHGTQVPSPVEAALRRALAPAPDDRFATVEEFAAALAADATPHATRAIAATPPRRGRRGLVAGLLAALALVVALVWVRRTPARPANADAVHSIAVLPFVNVSPGQEHEFFADGLTEELIGALSRVRGLRIVSRTTAFAYKGRDVDVREIGRELGVESVLEGSVRRSGDKLRVTARLISVDDGYQRWSESYDRKLADALAIQEEVSGAIVGELKGAFGDVDRAAVRQTPTDPETYDLYLKGRYAWHQRTEAGLRQALGFLKEATTRSPDFAAAHAGLGDTYAVMGFYDWLPPREAFPLAKQQAEAALALDPSLGAAHATLGYVALYYDWEWARADEEFRRAIDLSPSYSTAQQWYGNFLAAQGRFDESEAAMRRAMELDPLSVIANAALCWSHYMAGRHEQAVAQCRRTLELNPSFAVARIWGGLALEALGRSDSAVAWLTRGVELSGESAVSVAGLAHAYATMGDHVAAARWRARLEREAYVPPYELAKVQLAQGQKTEALASLARAFDQRSHSMAFLRVDPQLAPLRGDPAFEALQRRVGL